MRISRSTGAFSGLLIVLLAIWGGIIPFVGPYFHYSFGSNATWHYTADRLWLSIAPAVVAIVGGLAMIRSGHRVSGVVGSWIAMAAGAWYVVGPALSRIWEHGVGPIGQPLYGSTRQAVELIGYFYGVGALIVALSAFALGRFVTRSALAEPEPIAEPVATPEPAAAPGEPVANRQPVTSGAPGDSMAPSTPGPAAAAPPADDMSARPATTPRSTDPTEPAGAVNDEQPAARR